MPRGSQAKNPVVDGKKKCNLCGIVKDVSDFSIKSGKRYIVGHCKRCAVDRSLACHRRKQNQYRAKQKEYQQSLKRAAFMAYGGCWCNCCGEAGFQFLTLDHVNNDGAAHKQAAEISSGSTMYRWLKKHGYPSGFQVLCYNCNCGREANGGVCPHEVQKAQRLSSDGVHASAWKRPALARVKI